MRIEIVSAVIAFAAACGAAPPAHRETPTAAVVPPPACSIGYLHAAPPAVRVFASLAAAQVALREGATPSPDEDLVAEAAAHGPAFGTSILQRAYAGSTRIHRRHAVFVQGNRVIVLARLGDVMTSIPPSMCAVTEPDDVIAARILTSPRYPHLGHVRYRRAYVTDATTLPAVRATSHDAECPARTTRFRIEDHFIDLDTGEYVVGFAQVYDGPPGAEPSPAVPVDRLTASGAGIAVPGCDELRWPYPVGE